MTAAEMIIREKERSIQRYYRDAAQDKPQSAADIKKLKLYAEQLLSGTAHSAPLRKHPQISNDKVQRYARGSYKYSYAGTENCTLQAIAPGILFETKHGMFFYIFEKDKVVKMPPSTKRVFRNKNGS